MTPELDRLRRGVYSCFIVTNLFVIGYCNLPLWIGNEISGHLQLTQDNYYRQASLEPAGDRYAKAYREWENFIKVRTAVYQVDRGIRLYGHYVGLNNRWQMFGRQSRFNWWYVIRARYTDGERTEHVVLPLPRQSQFSGKPRTFWQYHFFDFREGKFHLNLYLDPVARAAYCRYLARTYPAHDGLPIESVAVELYYQNLKQPDEARRTGSHLYPEINGFLYNRFYAAGELERERGIYSLPQIEQSTGADGSAAADQ